MVDFSLSCACGCFFELFCRKERGGKYTHEIRKKERYIIVSVFVMKQCTPTTICTKEKQTVKRERFATTARARVDIQTRSLLRNTVEKRSAQQFSLVVSLWLFFCVL